MSKTALLVIDTDSEFSNRFSKRLQYHKLADDYEVINIVPDTTLEDKMVPQTIERVKKRLGTLSQVGAIFVDIFIIEGGSRFDTSGIQIAKDLKLIYPDMPIYNITGKVSLDEQLDIFSEATLEETDGVFCKKFLEGLGFDEPRLTRILGAAKDDKKQQSQPKSSSFDLAIITALYESEFENIKQIFEWTGVQEDRTKILHIGRFPTDSTTKKFSPLKVVAAHQPSPGMIDAAIFTTDILTRFNPKYLVMTGVCGGRDDDKMSFGDIVVASKLFTYQKGKENESTFQHEYEACELDSKLLQRLREKKDNILLKIMSADPSRSNYYRNRPLKMFIEPMACGTAVINKEGFFEEKILVRDRKTVAVDMESYAVVRACILANNGETTPIIVKSIMDKTKEKTDDTKSYAGYTSAQFLRYLLTDILFA